MKFVILLCLIVLVIVERSSCDEAVTAHPHVSSYVVIIFLYPINKIHVHAGCMKLFLCCDIYHIIHCYEIW